MENSTIIGIILGISGLLIGHVMEGQSISSLINESAAIIVFFGTFGATMVSFRMREFFSMFAYFKRALFPPKLDIGELISTFISFSEKARREGLLVLEEDLEDIPDPFFKKGIQLVIDGTDPEVIKEIMLTDMEKKEEHEKIGAEFFEILGGFAPTLGITGTVMGLIGAISHLDAGIDVVAENIASAFNATLYGIGGANLAFLPIGNKLKFFNKISSSYRSLIITGVLSLQQGDSPRIVQDKLIVFIEDEKERQQLLSQQD